jgi:uncharacterized membrane protein YfcA
MDVHVIHNVLIALHAASATLCFIAGCWLIFFPRQLSNGQLFALYGWTLVGSIVLLAGAILSYWTEYSSIERIVFPGLFVLGIYMLYRARSARRGLESQPKGWRPDAIEHIGFTLISLFEGFIIVSGLNSGLPGWLVAIIAILGVLLGRWLIRIAQRRVGSEQMIAPEQ